MKVRIIVHNRIRCKKCGETIESTFRHDYKWCSCGNCAVDGGHDYLRRCWRSDEWEDVSEFKDIEVTPKFKVDDVVLFTYSSGSPTLKGRIVSVNTFPRSDDVFYNIVLLDDGFEYRCIGEKYIKIIASKAA